MDNAIPKLGFGIYNNVLEIHDNEGGSMCVACDGRLDVSRSVPAPWGARPERVSPRDAQLLTSVGLLLDLAAFLGYEVRPKWDTVNTVDRI